jgi:hypothetical protein
MRAFFSYLFGDGCSHQHAASITVRGVATLLGLWAKATLRHWAQAGSVAKGQRGRTGATGSQRDLHHGASHMIAKERLLEDFVEQAVTALSSQGVLWFRPIDAVVVVLLALADKAYEAGRASSSEAA